MRCPTLSELPPPPPGKTGWPWTEESPQLSDTIPDGSLWPRVSIVTPSYNHGQFIEETIRSVLLQGYPNLQYIIIDGGSTDGSVDIIRKYEKCLSYWVSEPDKGQAEAVNKGWVMSTGDVIGYLNSDDVYHHGAFRQVVTAIRAHPKSMVLFGDCKVIDRFGKAIAVKCPEGYTGVTLLLGRSLPQASVFLRRQVLQDVGYLDSSLHYTLDWAYFLKVLWRYPAESFVHIPFVLSMSREYGGTKSRSGLSRKAEERRRVLSEYFKQNVLHEASVTMRRKGWAATYWVQAADEFMAGLYWSAVRSGLLAVRHDPFGLLYRLSRATWLFGEHLRRKQET